MIREQEDADAKVARIMVVSHQANLDRTVRLEDQLSLTVQHRTARPGDFRVRDGKLWRVTPDGLRLVIPSEAAREAIFDLAHAAAMAGHRSAATTEARIRAVAWWPAMTAWIAARCRACFACARAKYRTNQSPTPLRSVEAPLRPFEQIHIDAVEGLPEVEGYDNVWVVIDRFSHWVFLVPASSKDTARV